MTGGQRFGLFLQATGLAVLLMTVHFISAGHFHRTAPGGWTDRGLTWMMNRADWFVDVGLRVVPPSWGLAGQALVALLNFVPYWLVSALLVGITAWGESPPTGAPPPPSDVPRNCGTKP